MISSWRTALRIARREARRSKGRSSLVVAMIALPVLALAFAASSYDMFTLTATERADRTMGAADARLSWPVSGAVQQNAEGSNWYQPSDRLPSTKDEPTPPPEPTDAAVLAKLPAGSAVLPVRSGSVAMKTVNGIGEPNAFFVDARDPLTKGYLSILDGRAPVGPDEVALSEPAVERLGEGLGGTVTSADGTRSYTVVGLVEFPSLLQEVLLFAPMSGEPPKGMRLSESSWLVHAPAPVSWEDVGRLNADGIVVASRAVFANPPADDQFHVGPGNTAEDLAIGVIVGGLALLEVVLLAGPAFAVSARRRQRQLALVAANGGTPAHVRRIVLADGVVLGAVGAGFGIVLGIAAAFLARPFIEEYVTSSRAGGYRVFPVALVAIALLAVVTGLLAALVPAFITARQSVLASLAGRRGVTRSRKRWITLGLVMLAGGAAVVIVGTLSRQTSMMLGGMILGELGLVLCTPALVGLIARLGRFLPLAPRIALRDAGRNRAAAAPAISAVMAAVAGSVAAGLYLNSNVTQQQESYEAARPAGYASVYAYQYDETVPVPTATAIESAVRGTLPVTDFKPVSGYHCADDPAMKRSCQLTVELPADLVCPYEEEVNTTGELSAEKQKAAAADPRCGGNMNRYPYVSTVDDGTALPLLTGAPAADLAKATAVLRDGGVVVFDPKYVRDGKATISLERGGGMTTGEATEHVTATAYALTSGATGGGAIASPGLISRIGLAVSEAPEQYVVATSRMPTTAERDRFEAKMADMRISGGIENGLELQIPIQMLLIIAASGLITLGAAAIGTGLAAADGRADLSVLASVGASPSLRRGLSLSQSAVIAGLGSVLGAAAGLGSAVAILVADNQRWVDKWPAPTPMPITMPWLSLLAALVVIPLVAILGAGTFTRSRLPIERRL